MVNHAPINLSGLSADSAAFLKGDGALSTTTFEVKIGYSDLGVEEVSNIVILFPGGEGSKKR